MSGFAILLVLFGLMWLLLIRPQQQRMRRQRALVSTIDVGDEVVTAGGIVGRIVSAEDDRVVLEIGPDAVHLTLLRVAINRKLEEPVLGEPDEAGGAGQETPTDGPTDGPSDEGVS